MCFQGCIFFCLTPHPPRGGGWAKIWPNNIVGGKQLLKGNEKRGGNAYFFPNWLKVCICFPQLTKNLQNSTKKS